MWNEIFTEFTGRLREGFPVGVFIQDGKELKVNATVDPSNFSVLMAHASQHFGSTEAPLSAVAHTIAPQQPQAPANGAPNGQPADSIQHLLSPAHAMPQQAPLAAPEMFALQGQLSPEQFQMIQQQLQQGLQTGLFQQSQGVTQPARVISSEDPAFAAAMSGASQQTQFQPQQAEDPTATALEIQKQQG
jgi:hypothetical protein